VLPKTEITAECLAHRYRRLFKLSRYSPNPPKVPAEFMGSPVKPASDERYWGRISDLASVSSHHFMHECIYWLRSRDRFGPLSPPPGAGTYEHLRSKTGDRAKFMAPGSSAGATSNRRLTVATADGFDRPKPFWPGISRQQEHPGRRAQFAGQPGPSWPSSPNTVTSLPSQSIAGAASSGVTMAPARLACSGRFSRSP